jgi:23S rRNA (pseudouridine1915-N3)-methyltransferase
MRVRVLSVGKPKDREIGRLHERYAERIVALGVDYASVWVKEERVEGRYSDAHVREREAEALLRAAEPRGRRVALDPTGELLTTPDLASRLQRFGQGPVTFFVGGPLGLDPGLLARVDVAWSLSPLTFPHELVRVLLAEQIYRAITLRRGIPYHKGARRVCDS